MKDCHNFSIPVNDLEKATDFYQSILGLSINPDLFAKGMVTLKIDEKGPMVILKDLKSFPNTKPTIWFVVNDVREEYEKLKNIGVKFISEPSHNNVTELVAEFEDPFGNRLGIIENSKFDPIKNIINKIKDLESVYWQKNKEGRGISRWKKTLILGPLILFFVTWIVLLIMHYFNPEIISKHNNGILLALIIEYLLILLVPIVSSLKLFKQFWHFPSNILKLDIEQLLNEIEIEDKILVELKNCSCSIESFQATKERLQERVNQLEWRINFIGRPKNYGIIYLIGAIGLLYTQFTNFSVSIIPVIVIGMVVGSLFLNYAIGRYKFYIYLLSKIIESDS